MTKSAAQLEDEIKQALHAPSQSHGLDSGFEGFSSWADVLTAARRGDRLWYKPPMDRYPKSIHVIKVFKNGSIRIDPLSNQADKFTANRGHLDRFRRKT